MYARADCFSSDSGAENFFVDKNLEKNVRDAVRCGRNIYQEFITMPAPLTCSAHLSSAIFTADTVEELGDKCKVVFASFFYGYHHARLTDLLSSFKPRHFYS